MAGGRNGQFAPSKKNIYADSDDRLYPTKLRTYLTRLRKTCYIGGMFKTEQVRYTFTRFTTMPNFTINNNTISAASRADYIQLVQDYASGADYLDTYDDRDWFADALIDAADAWLSFEETEQLFVKLGLA